MVETWTTGVRGTLAAPRATPNSGVLPSRFERWLCDALLSLQNEATLQALHRAAVECPSLEAFAERL
jgi:hypothetical protein